MPPEDDLRPADEEDFIYDPERKRKELVAGVSKSVFPPLERAQTGLIRLHDDCATLLQGQSVRASAPGAFLAGAIRMIPPGDEREKFESLCDDMLAITDEKGFRAYAGIASYAEHRAIGSTMPGRFETKGDSNVPTGVQNQRWRDAGGEWLEQEQLHTLEEADRARRLEGMTVLDPETGRTTDTRDEEAAKDSYHFLTPEGKEVAMAREQEILAEVARIATWACDKVAEAKGIVEALERYSQGGMTTPDMQAAYVAWREQFGEDNTVDLTYQIREAKSLSFQTGTRDAILTPQEIALMAGREAPEAYREKPYTPLAVQDEQMTAEEVRRLRQGEDSMVVLSGITGKDMEQCFGFRLEDINAATGEVVAGLTMLDRDGEPWTGEQKEYFVDKITVPYARPDDWFYREPNA